MRLAAGILDAIARRSGDGGQPGPQPGPDPASQAGLPVPDGLRTRRPVATTNAATLLSGTAVIGLTTDGRRVVKGCSREHQAAGEQCHAAA